MGWIGRLYDPEVEADLRQPPPPVCTGQQPDCSMVFDDCGGSDHHEEWCRTRSPEKVCETH